MKTTTLALTAAALLASAVAASAQSAGTITAGIGVGNVNPKSGNGTLAGLAADVDDNTQLTITGEYFVLDNVGIEILASTPFSHDISLAGVGFAGSTDHLPPTVSVNYHFPTGTIVTPYVGVGLNYTIFFDEESPLGNLELDNSFGIALQAGADFQISPQGSLRLNARWIDIDTDVTLNGAPIGTAEIDPVVLNVAYVHRF